MSNKGITYAQNARKLLAFAFPGLADPDRGCLLRLSSPGPTSGPWLAAIDLGYGDFLCCGRSGAKL